MPRSEASKKQQYAYSREYQKNFVVQKKLILNLKNEDDAILANWIDAQPESTTLYFRRLVQEDMSRAASEKANVDQ
jgi:hypothetical protein